MTPESSAINPRNPGSVARPDLRAWVSALGPGAIVASLTIGTGELIFSTRAGALFGYRALGVFLVVLLLKWALVLGSARFWVFSDVHPLRTWSELPGPRGWLPMVLLLLAVPAFPVWVSFHSGTIGTLLAALTNTRDLLGGGAPLAWGIAVLVGIQILAATGSYARQEKFQAVVVAVMLGSVVIALALLKPDWFELALGFVHFGPLKYPEWAASLPAFSQRPVWVEVATYAGVIGGSGYDYLAYVGWLRDKHGTASRRRTDPATLMRFVVADATVSFLAVLAFSAVFVACGAIVLGPRHQIPSGGDLLTLQAQFVDIVGPWLKPLYFIGALLALVGTLYGTIEVAPAVLRELLGALLPADAVPAESRQRGWAVRWCGGGALVILSATLLLRLVRGTQQPLDLVAWVTPANLLTGVLACGWISLLNVWTHSRFATPPCRMGVFLTLANLLGGIAFLVVGLKAAWDQAGAWSLAILAISLGAGIAFAAILRRQRAWRPAPARE